jgi:SAM-dependent methyltransferase
MDVAEYTRMEQLERDHWWHVGRLEILRRELSRRLSGGHDREPTILNVGCGTGGTIRMLESFGQVLNVDVSDEAIALSRSHGFQAEKVTDHRLPYPDGSIDVVAALDVLEHIEDDQAALQEWARVLRPGGFVLLTVPAYQWLWSDHDVALHHHRRYLRRQIARMSDQAGLRVGKLSYAIVFSLPLVVGFRLLNRMRGTAGAGKSNYVAVPTWINRLFVGMLQLEARAHRMLRFPAGSSVLAVLRKP